MRNIVLIFVFSIFLYANDNVGEFEEFDNEFDQEFIKKETQVIFDPLNGYNRVITRFNDGFYENILNPVAKGYSSVVHEEIRVSISNFFDNLLFPVRFTNNLLQFKLKNSTEELGRFVVNTIWGLGGFLDPATDELNWKQHNEDFGQTLGVWGVKEGFHVVLPLLGPSNLRDIVGIAADNYINPLSKTGSKFIKYKIPNNIYEQIGIQTFQTVNKTSLRLGQYEALKKDALDLYPFLRDIYTQKRNQEIKE